MLDDKGSPHPSEGQFLSVLGFKDGRNYSSKEITDRLSRMEELLDHKVTGWKVLEAQKVLQVSVVGKKKIGSIEFEGNHSISSSDIREEVGSRVIGSYCEDTCVSIVQNTKKLYNDQGFYNADVRLSESPMEDGRLQVTVRVDEGAPALISSFNVEAEGFLSVSEIRDIVGIRTGDRLVASKLNDRLRELRTHLYNRSYYSNTIFRNTVKVSKDKTSATVELGVRTGPRYNLFFEGNTTFSNPKTLKNAMDITETDVVSKEYYSVLVKKLEDFYRKYGFADVSVDVREELGSGKGELDLVFVINEGIQKFFGRVEFTIKDKKYRRSLRSYLEDARPDLFDNGYFIKKDFEDLKTDVERFFNEEGFLRTRVAKVVFTPRGRNLVDISYDVDMEQPTLVREMIVQGNTVLDGSRIIGMLGIRKGETVRIPVLSDGIKKLVQAYRDKGYIDMYLDQEELFSYSEDFRFVDVTVNIYEGQKYRVGKLFINGLVSTKERVITREMRLEEGDMVDLDQLQASENAISGLSIFSSVSVVLLPGSVKGEGYRDVLVKVEEKRAGLYEFGIGYRTDDGIRFSSGISYYNLGGWNRRIYTSGAISRKLTDQYKFIEYEINGGYYEPYLFNIPFDLRINVGFKKEDLPDYGKKKLDLALYFEKQMGSHYLALRNAFERVNIFDAVLPADESIYWKYSVRPSYRYDSRDSIFNPTRGVNFLVYGEWGHSLKSSVIVDYLKAVQRTRVYFSPIRNWVIVTSFDSGYIKGLKGDSILQDERFSLGGVDSVRGYRESVINDKTPQLPHQYYYTFTFEVRRKLFWNFVGSVFHDIGSIYSEDSAVQGPFSSVGAGLSLRFAVGSISLQYGYIYNTQKRIPADRAGRLHLSIGTF